MVRSRTILAHDSTQEYDLSEYDIKYQKPCATRIYGHSLGVGHAILSLMKKNEQTISFCSYYSLLGKFLSFELAACCL